MKDSIAIITARGGSKRIPRKNIRPFCGKPMIAWSIEVAIQSACFEHVIVSTDDEEIAEISVKYGAKVPFLRPAELADDFTHAHVAARHMLEWALKELGQFKYLAHIYPTSPMLTVSDIHMGHTLMLEGKDFAYTAQKISFPIYQVVTENEIGVFENLFPPEKASMRSQDMPDAYIDAGQLYWRNIGVFLDSERDKNKKRNIIPISAQRAVDIDTEEDLAFAEVCMKLFQEQQKNA